MMLRKLKIGTRLALGFGMILAIMVVVAVAGTALGKKSRDDMAAVVEAATAKERLAAEMKSLMLEQSSAMRDVGLHSDIKSMQADEDRSRLLGRKYDEALERMGPERELLQTLSRIDKTLDAPFMQAIGQATQFRSEEAAQVLTNEIDPQVQRALAELNRLIEMQNKANQEAIAASRATGDRIAMSVYVVQVLVLLLAGLVAWALTRSITRPISDAVAVARRVAGGDLKSEIAAGGSDEAAELMGALREMNEGLAAMVAHIRGGAESIAV